MEGKGYKGRVWVKWAWQVGQQVYRSPEARTGLAYSGGNRKACMVGRNWAR